MNGLTLVALARFVAVWIGEIRPTSDDEPITVDPIDELEVSVGEAVEFRAAATGGISPLQHPGRRHRRLRGARLP